MAITLFFKILVELVLDSERGTGQIWEVDNAPGLRSDQGLVPFFIRERDSRRLCLNHRRIRGARAWLEGRRLLTEEMLIIGASLDTANELARRLAKEKGAALGWHRLTLPQLAATLAASKLAERNLAPLSRLAAQAIVGRVVHRLKREGGLGRYQTVGETPGFARAIAAVIAELRLARLACGLQG